MRQDNAMRAHLNAPTAILIDIDVFANEATGQIIDLQLDALAVILQGQVFANVTLVSQAEDFADLTYRSAE